MNYTSTMRFIDLFRQHRALWDRSHVDYLNKAERIKLRESIGFSMGMTEVGVCKKICNLRTYYLREMLKRDKVIQQGQFTLETYVPKWPYFHALDSFLHQVVRKKRNEYVTADGTLQEISYLYADEHLSDNDTADDFSNENDVCTDNSSSCGGGSGEGPDSAITNTSAAVASDSIDDSFPAKKRLKPEPPDDCEASVYTSKGDSNNRGRDLTNQSKGLEFLGTCPVLGRDTRGEQGPNPAISKSLQIVSSYEMPSFTVTSFSPARSPAPNPPGHPPSALRTGVAGRGGHALSMPGIQSPSVGATFGCTCNHSNRIAVPPGMVLVEEDDDWLFGRYMVGELKKVKNFKDKQMAKMKMQQIVTYAQLGMGEQPSSSALDS